MHVAAKFDNFGIFPDGSHFVTFLLPIFAHYTDLRIDDSSTYVNVDTIIEELPAFPSIFTSSAFFGEGAFSFGRLLGTKGSTIRPLLYSMLRRCR